MKKCTELYHPNKTDKEHTLIDVDMWVDVYVLTHMPLCMCVCVYMCICVYVYVCMCVYVCTCVCVYVCMCVYVHVCI